ncbi:MAG: hypothetical protein R2788_01985 [Saprospiraceae bacterium]
MKNLSFHLVIVLLFFACANSVVAQRELPFRVGFQLTELHSDFGLGLNLDVPLPGKLPTLRLAGNWHWLEIPGETRSQTASFQTIRLGIANEGWEVAEKIKVYGEGGVLFLLPANMLSGDGLATGGYGLFGFEFFAKEMNGSSLFLEVGGTSAGRRVERRESVPTFGAGLLLGAGLRVAI